MEALSLTLFAAAVAAEPSSHILSDTPSYLNRAPILASFFSVDVDRNATSSACSGRGLQLGEPRHECHCNPGYSGVSCEHPGAAWSSGRLALSHTAALVSVGGSTPPTTLDPPPKGMQAMSRSEHQSRMATTSFSSRGWATTSGGFGNSPRLPRTTSR